MEKIAILTDSCGDIPVDDQQKYDIFVLPLVIECNQVEYKDGVNIHPEDIYQLQKEHVLKTASPEGKDIIDTFESIKDKGYTHVIGIMLSSGLSGTANSVRLLAQSIDDLTVEILDSKSGSIGYGSIAIVLAQYRDQGYSFQELIEKAHSLIQNTHIFFSIDSLEYLQKGGRIGKATAFVGGVMKIKPILSVNREDGEINVAAKVRGSKKVPAKLIDLVTQLYEQNPQRPFNLLVADGAMREQRDLLEQELKSHFPQFNQCIAAQIGSTLSAYLGPGLLGAAIQFLDD